ncbi:MAG: ATP-binding cassette domain-containing protein [Candidatus Latescibacteria bacterium]|nr:ATP-binding cassette domain-containing protein [Candidatus Latescibacterota bacterium]
MIAALVRRPVLVSMLLTGGCLLGWISYNRLAVELIPFAELPMLVVQVGSATEADPHFIEQQAIVQLESAIASLEEIERIESYIQPGQATLFVYYAPGSQQQYAYLKLQQRVDSVRPLLGDQFQTFVWRIDTEQLANQFISLEARGGGGLDRIRHVVDRHVVTQLEQIDGIANIAVYGGRQRSVEVLLNEDELQSHGLSLGQVANSLSQASRPRRFLGRLEEETGGQFVNLAADYSAMEEIGQTLVKADGTLRLGQIARIVDGGAQPQSIARINGLEAITLSLVRDRQANLLELSRTTRAQIEQLNESLAPHGVELVIASDAAEAIEENIGAIKSLAAVGALLAIGLLWVFLRHLALVAVVALSIPVSVLIALNLFYVFDISLNTLSLVGIAVAIGMLLDNSIVVLESIYRQFARQPRADQAIAAGMGEVWRAVSAATVTSFCIFLPFFFSSNFLVRILGRHVGVSIISTLLVSLVVAFLLIPIFAYRLFSRTSRPAPSSFNRVSQRQRLVQIYALLLKSCLRKPGRTLGLAVVAFFVSILLCLGLSVSLPEEVELDSFELWAGLPSGTTLAVADEQAVQMDGRLADIAELKDRRVEIQDDLLHFTFALAEDYQAIARRDLAAVRKEVRDRLRRSFPRVDFSAQQPRTDLRFRGGGGQGADRAFQRLLGIGTTQERIAFRGNDLELLQVLGDQIRFNLERLPGVRQSQLQMGARQPSIDLRFDRTTLAHFGISSADLAATFNNFQPRFSTGVRLKSGDEEIDILLVTAAEDEPRQIDDLRRLQVRGAAGGQVPLLQLAELTYDRGYGQIARVNQEKEIELTYDFDDQVTSSRQLLEQRRAAVDALVADFTLPPGVSVEVLHDEADLSDFYFLIAAAVLLIYMILASVFESPTAPLAMMITLPLATIGAFWGLILTGHSIFNANALVGFLILLGVVVNNGIMLIDYTRLLQRRGYRLSRALLTAGQVRVRPILITVLSTALAMLPLAMGKVEYVARIGAPFAVTVIGGLVAGTLFTLLLVPTAYYGLGRTLAWVRALPPPLKGAQLVVLAGGFYLIYANVDSVFWQFVDGTALLALVPALIYFARTSLRRSQAQLIEAGAPLRISIANLVKVYDGRSRFARQWGRWQRQQAQSGVPVQGRAALVWKMPLLGFLVYFVYFYLDTELYVLLFSVGVYLFVLELGYRYLPSLPWKVDRVLQLGGYWLLPLPHLLWYHQRWDDKGALVVIIGLLWYLAISIHLGARKLRREELDINRLSGRLRRTRKAFYRLVGAIPILGKKKRPFTALDQVSLEIDSGMFGLIGPNGAGKTTLMRIICGILEESRGTVSVNQFNLRQYREEMQALIGYLPQEFGTYEGMKARQFLDYQALLKGKWDAEQRRAAVNAALAAVHLDDSAERKIGEFSGGMKQRLGIAQTLLHLPRILVVDEPTAGLDPRERIRFRNMLAELARDRIVIFSTHIIEDISSSCNRLAVLAEGRVRFHGTPQELVQLTRGAVWQARVSADEFASLHQRTRIVHHARQGDTIRVRMLAEKSPLAGAEPVAPTLEDSYLWLVEGGN